MREKKGQRNTFMCRYRALDEITMKDDFPMENVNDLINTIGQRNIIISLDILKSHSEIPLEESSRDFTTFKTHRSQYSPLQLGKIGEKIYKVFKFLSNTL